MLKILKYSNNIEKNMFFPFYGKHTLMEEVSMVSMSVSILYHYLFDAVHIQYLFDAVYRVVLPV